MPFRCLVRVDRHDVHLVKEKEGKNFESEIRRSLKSSKHIWWFRIQDTNDINRFVKQAVAEKQPADPSYERTPKPCPGGQHRPTGGRFRSIPMLRGA